MSFKQAWDGLELSLPPAALRSADDWAVWVEYAPAGPHRRRRELAAALYQAKQIRSGHRSTCFGCLEHCMVTGDMKTSPCARGRDVAAQVDAVVAERELFNLQHPPHP